MFYVCTICMMKKGNLVKLKPQLRIIVQVAVAPFVDDVELKKLAMTVCLSCSQWIKNFQDKLIPGVNNMITLNRRFNTSSRLEWRYMSLPDIIDDNCNVFLPIANQETVCTTDTHATINETSVLQPPAPQICSRPLPKRVFIKADSIISLSGVLNTIADRRQFLDKASFDDHGYSINVPVPKSVKILARRVEMVDHFDKGYHNENKMEMPTPTIEKYSKNGMELKNTSQSEDVQRTKLNRQLYKAIQLAVKSISISEKFDISQYEPESSESALEDVPECPDSESTLSGESDYDDAENFPNIIFAKAFDGITEDTLSGDQQKAHMIADPPSEWPCTAVQCPLDGDDFEADDEDAPTEEASVHVDEGGRKLCKKTRLSRKNKASAPNLLCAECGVSTRGYTLLAKHFATAKHIARMQWRYQCDICKRKFEFKKGIAEHIQMEHLARETCPMCAASFKSARALHRHVAAHILAQTDTQDLQDETQSVYTGNHLQSNKHTDTCTGDTQTNRTTQKRNRSSENRGTDRYSPAQDADNGVQDNTEDHLQEETQSVQPNHSRSQNAHALRKDTATSTRDTQNKIPTRKNKNSAHTRRYNTRKRARPNKPHARTAQNNNHEELRTQGDGYLHELPMHTHAPDNTNGAEDITHTPTPVEGYKNKHARTNTNTRTLTRTALNDNHKQHRDQDDDYHLHVRSLHAQDNAYTQDITNPTLEQDYKNKRATANTKTDSRTAQDDHEQPLAPKDDYSQVISMLLAQENSTEAITDAPTPLHGNKNKRSSTSNETHIRTVQDDPEQSLAPEDDYLSMLSRLHAEDNTCTQDITHARISVQGKKHKRARTNTKTHPRTAQDYHEQSLVPDDDYLKVLSMHAQDNACAQDINHTFTLGQGNKHKRTRTNTKTHPRTAHDYHEQSLVPEDDYLQVLSMHAEDNAYAQDINHTFTLGHGYKNKRARTNTKTESRTAQVDHEQTVQPDDEYSQVSSMLLAQENNTQDITETPTPVQSDKNKRANKIHTRTAQNDNHEQLRAQADNSHELLIHTQAQDNTYTKDIIHTPTPVQGNTHHTRARTNNKSYASTAQDADAQDNTRHRTHTQTKNSHTNKQRNGTQKKKARKRAKDVTYSWAQAQSSTHIQQFIHIRNGRVVKRTTRKIRPKRQKQGESDAGLAHSFQHLLV